MMYMSFLVLLGLVVGLAAVASNPSPYYAAFGLVLSAICGCLVLVDFGISFLSIVLLLIYLGGMLVVFAYSASLAAEPYPEAWGSWSVLAYMLMYLFGIFIIYMLVGGWQGYEILFSGNSLEVGVVVYDCSGVGIMFSLGVAFLVVSGWALLLTLFVVLEVTRGVARGALRAV
uniref:NADH-ubiquinone oxidoreductase chain 6 n=1 Tax=Eurycea cirrigera TaxID=332575 RepID=A0A343ERC4_9SALA|nr:NADH dehydrogenase subunit 6 [Eurycea cirrigera]ASK85752.1 NADH dehydrogenase subunit 6 [Eurycea cirrigera]ASS30855.1 NADH dehydrogenase subunit 6 [Eurycea cirrigera]